MNYDKSNSGYTEEALDEHSHSVPLLLMEGAGIEHENRYEIVDKVLDSMADGLKASKAVTYWKRGESKHLHGYEREAAENFNKAIDLAAEIDEGSEVEEGLEDIYRQNLETECSLL